MTYEYIKNMVELESGIPNLSKRGTDKIIRSAYYKLCTMHIIDWSYLGIAKSLGRADHTDVSLSVVEFDFLLSQNSLNKKCKSLYDKCWAELRQMYKDSLEAKEMNVEYETV